MNTAKKVWVIIGSIVIGLALICFVFGIFLKYVFKVGDNFGDRIVSHGITRSADDYQNNTNTTSIDNQLDLSNTSEINMKVRLGTINFVEGDQFNVTAKNVLSEYYTVSFDGSALKIEYQEDFNYYDKLFGTNHPNPVFTVTVPKGTSLNELDIKVGVADLNIDDIVSNDVDIECGVGSAVIDNVAFNNFELSSGTSDITFDGKLTGKTKIEGGVGSVDLTVKGVMTDYELTGLLGMGSLEINNEHYDGIGKDLNFNSGAPNSIEINNGIGDIVVDFVE